MYRSRISPGNHIGFKPQLLLADSHTVGCCANPHPRKSYSGVDAGGVRLPTNGVAFDVITSLFLIVRCNLPLENSNRPEAKKIKTPYYRAYEEFKIGYDDWFTRVLGQIGLSKKFDPSRVARLASSPCVNI